MDILARSTPLLRVRECAALLLKLLQHCCKIKSNRTRMLSASATQALLRMLPEALEHESLGAVAERLLLTVESLLEEELAAQEDLVRARNAEVQELKSEVARLKDWQERLSATEVPEFNSSARQA